jgi:hypothetical protein
MIQLLVIFQQDETVQASVCGVSDDMTKVTRQVGRDWLWERCGNQMDSPVIKDGGVEAVIWSETGTLASSVWNILRYSGSET